MNYVTPTSTTPCRHYAYTSGTTSVPPGMARCGDCREVFLPRDLTQVCSDAAYATKPDADDLHSRCPGYVVTPIARCECTCHGGRFIAPARPAVVTADEDPDDGTPHTRYEWPIQGGTVHLAATREPAVLVLPDGILQLGEPERGLTLSSVGEVDELLAALVAARARLERNRTTLKIDP